MRLHVRVAREQLQANPAGILVVGEGGCLELRVLVVLLVLVRLEHNLALHHAVAGLAVVRSVDVIVVGDEGHFLEVVLGRRRSGGGLPVFVLALVDRGRGGFRRGVDELGDGTVPAHLDIHVHVQAIP